MASDGAPTARGNPVAMWTGHELLIWGGESATGYPRGPVLGDGARYNPATDTWRPMSSDGAPSPRVVPAVVWTGSELLMWSVVTNVRGAKMASLRRVASRSSTGRATTP
jgi:hypothetical protein